MGEGVVGQILHQTGVQFVFFLRQQAAFQCGGHQCFQITAGVAGVGIFGGNYLALLGNADLAGHAACRLCQNGLIGRTAAAADTSAATVKQAQADLVFAK